MHHGNNSGTFSKDFHKNIPQNIHDGLCYGSSTFTAVFERKPVKNPNLKFYISQRLNEICHGNLNRYFDGMIYRHLYLHNHLYEKSAASYFYYNWLLKESPMRNVYKRTSVKRFMEEGGEVKIDAFKTNQVLCAAIATRYPHEHSERLKLMVEWHSLYKSEGISITAIWVLLCLNFQPTRKNSEFSISFESEHHDVLHPRLNLEELASLSRSGFKKTRYKREAFSHYYQSLHGKGCSVYESTGYKEGFKPTLKDVLHGLYHEKASTWQAPGRCTMLVHDVLPALLRIQNFLNGA
jgi:hypothetical protein